ncbi:MAG: hypothetical protein JRI32_02335 [Deltaproteobacteria bacterium]|nr:hypothetical protein [Deltaproteobacteria bacterium]
MRDTLESLLISSVIELHGNNDSVIVETFKSTMKLLLENQELFKPLPKCVYISSDSLKKTEGDAGFFVGLAKDVLTGSGVNVENTVENYEAKAVLLHDGLHASAFGKMSFIYRSKGLRLYLFDTSEVKIITPYSHIDHTGFQLNNEPVDGFETALDYFDSSDSVREFLSCLTEDFNNRDEVKFVCGDLIKILCNIKMPFTKDYYLEYLLTPPDVDKLSFFSAEVRRALWDISLSSRFVKSWGQNIQNESMNILSNSDVAPTTGQLVAYIGELKNDDSKLELILERLNQIEDNVVNTVKDTAATDAKDILEIKPNMCGIGFNGNELYKKLIEWWHRRNA